MIIYLRSVYPDCQPCSVMNPCIKVTGRLLFVKNSGRIVILVFCNNLQLINASFNDLIAYLILPCFEQTSKINYQ